MDTNELLNQVCRQLEIPSEGASVANEPAAPVLRGEAWHRLRQAIHELEQTAACIGELPRGYPMHLNAIIRVLHALLPWYSRPLRRHAEQTVAVAKALEAVLDRLGTQGPEVARRPLEPEP